jgi:hypothetical protein
MEAALFGLGVREMLVKRGLERVREFTWDRSAHTLYAMFQSLVPDEVRVPGVREAIA